MLKKYVTDLKKEFSGYNGKKLSADLMSGLTVAAVALPLALAFGVSSGADAASGLITAIIAGIVILWFTSEWLKPTFMSSVYIFPPDLYYRLSLISLIYIYLIRR